MGSRASGVPSIGQIRAAPWAVVVGVVVRWPDMPVRTMLAGVLAACRVLELVGMVALRHWAGVVGHVVEACVVLVVVGSGCEVGRIGGLDRGRPGLVVHMLRAAEWLP